MNPDDAIDMGREAINTVMRVGGPILLVGVVLGIVIGIIQAMTQVQDQTVSFVPKVLVMLLCLGLALPWLSEQMLDFARTSFEKPSVGYSGSFAHGLETPKPDGTIKTRPYYDRDVRNEPTYDKTAQKQEFRFPQEFR